jgi:signal transduction histidine kinase
MRLLHLGRPFPAALGREAGREAVTFPLRHHLREAALVPLVCLPPVYVYLTWAADAPLQVLAHITIATTLGVATAVSIAYLVIERLMRPVARRLTNFGVEVDYENLPANRLHQRLVYFFTLTTIITAVMIVALATHQVRRLARFPGDVDRVVRNLRVEAAAVTFCAVMGALAIWWPLARSVRARMRAMDRTMRDVGAGCLKQRVAATSRDELGMLGRGFNRMVGRLEEDRRANSELNAGLRGDVHELRTELELAKERLIHAEKMSALGELAVGIAHEINNSIHAACNGIVPLRERLEELRATGVRPSKPGQEAVRELRESFESINELAEIVERGAKRAAGIVNDLKHFAHPGEGRLETFDVNDGLRTALSLLSHKLTNRVTVRQTYCADGRLMCRGPQLVQVFLNLLDNAQQAIPGSGEIRITTERIGRRLLIRVQDSGDGVPKDVRGRIFDAFFTTKRVGVGTGLGLSISYGIVKGHGGMIEVASPPPGGERGSEFTVTLPLEVGDAGGIEPPRQRDTRPIARA